MIGSFLTIIDYHLNPKSYHYYLLVFSLTEASMETFNHHYRPALVLQTCLINSLEKNCRYTGIRRAGFFVELLLAKPIWLPLCWSWIESCSLMHLSHTFLASCRSRASSPAHPSSYNGASLNNGALQAHDNSTCLQIT